MDRVPGKKLPVERTEIRSCRFRADVQTPGVSPGLIRTFSLRRKVAPERVGASRGCLKVYAWSGPGPLSDKPESAYGLDPGPLSVECVWTDPVLHAVR
jgi:hypothetical protein